MTSTEKGFMDSKKAKSTLLAVGCIMAILAEAGVLGLWGQPGSVVAFQPLAMLAIPIIAAVCGFHVWRQSRIDERQTAPAAA